MKERDFMRNKTVLSVLIVLFFISSFSFAKSIYVDAEGHNEPGTGSYEDPFVKIQDAIDSADTQNGDTVIVMAGIYFPSLSSGINFNGKSITVCSSDPNDPEIVASTVIDCNGTRRGFYFNHGEDANSVLEGLTVRNGYANYGGGIYCFNESNPKIAKCVIENNKADYGGGICAVLSSPLIANNVITGNIVSDANHGGGAAFTNSNPIIINCTIINNNSGMFCHTVGEGKYTTTVVNCIFAHNSGLGIRKSSTLAEVYIEYCCFYDNLKGDFYDFDTSSILTGAESINALTVANNNIGDDPVVDANDYHLGQNSGCINAGAPLGDYSGQTDIDGQRRVIGVCVDIGCDEFHLTGDLDYDGCVDMPDMEILARDWLKNGEKQIADINGDGAVDYYDFVLFAGNWKASL